MTPTKSASLTTLAVGVVLVIFPLLHDLQEARDYVPDMVVHPVASTLGSLLPTAVLMPLLFVLLKWQFQAHEAKWKACEHCLTRIPAAARVCRHCQRDQAVQTAMSAPRFPWRPVGLWVAATVVLALAAVGAAQAFP